MGVVTAGMQWAGLLMVLARVGAALLLCPPFAHAAVPRRVRAMMALALTIGLAGGVSVPAEAQNLTVGAFALALGGEVLIGLAMGLAISLVFSAANWAGELISQQLGLSLAEAYDPGGGGAEGTSLGRAMWMLAVVIFLAANGHHALLRGLRGSFDAVPVMSAVDGNAVVTMLVGLVQSATMLALQLAIPAFVATFAADIALGLVARTIPQAGGIAVGLPLRALTGLIVLIAGIAMSVGVLQGATLNWMQLVQTLTRSLGR
jgi:flagellar biosynthetic protein FliR